MESYYSVRVLVVDDFCKRKRFGWRLAEPKLNSKKQATIVQFSCTGTENLLGSFFIWYIIFIFLINRHFLYGQFLDENWPCKALCDGIKHCSDFSDETHLSCPPVVITLNAFDIKTTSFKYKVSPSNAILAIDSEAPFLADSAQCVTSAEYLECSVTDATPSSHYSLTATLESAIPGLKLNFAQLQYCPISLLLYFSLLF